MNNNVIYITSMIRRKKLLKLGKVKPVHKTKEQKAFEKMVEQATKNYQNRLKDKKEQERLRQKLYAREDKPSAVPIEPNEGWLNGIAAKKTIFDPVKFSNIDTDEINEKRKQNNILTTIEEGAQIALEQAKEKATRVAVICHKSSYQYVGSGKDSKDFGKKTNQMEDY